LRSFAAMFLSPTPEPNLIGGRYAAPAARWVCEVRGRRAAGDFFGRAGLVLALETGLAEAGEGVDRHPRRILATHGFLPFLAGRFGYVARCVVAWGPQGLVKTAFLEGSRQIANLTTRGAERAQIGQPGGLPAPIGGGVSPLSRRRATPNVPGVRRSWSSENLSEGSIATCRGERIDGCEGPRSSVAKMGSGVRAFPRRETSGAKRAESVRRAMGRGEAEAHHPLGAGKSESLTPPAGSVNEIPKGRPVLLARHPAGGDRAAPRGVQRAPRRYRRIE
jgi:hypothetical protein